MEKLNNHSKERIGVHLAALKVEKLGIIFRETSNTDIGIDGQIELFIDDYKSKLFAVQIKYGKSYFDNKEKDYQFIYYPNEKHIQYWSSFPLPVLIFLVHPDTEEIYYANASYQFSINKKVIEVSKSNLVNSEFKTYLTDLSGQYTNSFNSFDEILTHMISKKWQDGGLTLNYFEIFCTSLIDGCRGIFYDTSIIFDILDSACLHESIADFSMDEKIHEFYMDFFKLLISETIIKYDFNDFLNIYVGFEIQPKLTAFLTPKGKEFVEFLQTKFNFVYESFLSITAQHSFTKYDQMQANEYYMTLRNS